MYTETLPGDHLGLFIPVLTEGMAGTYYCSASYANTQLLETSVDIQTYGKPMTFIFDLNITCIWHSRCAKEHFISLNCCCFINFSNIFVVIRIEIQWQSHGVMHRKFNSPYPVKFMWSSVKCPLIRHQQLTGFVMATKWVSAALYCIDPDLNRIGSMGKNAAAVSVKWLNALFIRIRTD